jgi:hypothetical protein
MRSPSSLPGRYAGPREKGSGCVSEVPSDLVRDHLRRLCCQREESEEVPAAGRIRSEATLKASEGFLVLEQRNDDAFGRRMLPLSEPGAEASRGPSDRSRVPLKDPQSFSFLPVLETEAREAEEHGEARARVRIELAGTGNFIFARSRRTRRVQPEEHRR